MCNTHYERQRRSGRFDVAPRLTGAARFWSKVDKNRGCWIWQGVISTGGYGRYYWQGRERQAHRIAYELLIGPIPEGLHIDHLCRTRACVDPSHMEPVTPGENVRRGEAPMIVRSRASHCQKGHEFTPENCRFTKLGYRKCRTCDNAAAARMQKARRQAKVASAACVVCGKDFTYTGHRRRICSDACQLERGRQLSRDHQRRKRASA